LSCLSASSDCAATSTTTPTRRLRPNGTSTRLPRAGVSAGPDRRQVVEDLHERNRQGDAQYGGHER
jgi:hypothetical protein